MRKKTMIRLLFLLGLVFLILAGCKGKVSLKKIFWNEVSKTTP